MIEGSVVKIIDNKTVKVNVVNVVIHPVYGKVLRKTKSVMCHVENIELSNGDKVFVECSRPYSKMKKHIVVKKA